MKRILAGALCLISFASNAEVSTGATYFPQKNDSWQSGLLVGTGYRLRTTTLSKAGYAFYVDFMDGDCSTYYIGIARAIAKPVEKDSGDVAITGELRIDSNQTIPVKITFNAKMGDDTYIFYVNALPDPLGFLGQMQSGKELRVKLDFGTGEPIYDTFPLNGFAQSFQRSRYLCTNRQDPTKPSIASSKKYL